MMRRGLMACGVLLVVAALAAAQDQGGGRGGRGGRGPGGFGGFGGPGGPGMMQGGPGMLLMMPEVQQELGLTEEQKQKLQAAGEEMRGQMQGVFGSREENENLSEEERAKRREEARAKMEELGKQNQEKIAQILDAKQLERLNQLQIQREGLSALYRDKVAQAVGLTEEQQAKLAKLREEARQAWSGFGRGMSDEDRRAAFTKAQEAREKARTELESLLTEEQKAKFNEMKGAEFKFPEMRFGRGPGGPGGPGGGERRRPPREQ